MHAMPANAPVVSSRLFALARVNATAGWIRFDARFDLTDRARGGLDVSWSRGSFQGQPVFDLHARAAAQLALTERVQYNPRSIDRSPSPRTGTDDARRVSSSVEWEDR
jgi:hypothetical protein